MTRPDRSSRRYKELRTAYRAECQSKALRCWLCQDPIDYTLPREHPECFNLDHALPVSQRPDLLLDPANFRPSHKVCNERRGDDEPTIDLGEPSEDW